MDWLTWTCFRCLIPIHGDFNAVGSLPPLDAPHHQRSTEWNRFREGVVVSQNGSISQVDIGLEKAKPDILSPQSAFTERQSQTKTQKRHACDFKCRTSSTDRPRNGTGFLFRQRLPSDASNSNAVLKVCSFTEPVTEYGDYWGFAVRIAQGLSSVFMECPFASGYDLVIGTSERGDPVRCQSFSLSECSSLDNSI